MRLASQRIRLALTALLLLIAAGCGGSTTTIPQPGDNNGGDAPQRPRFIAGERYIPRRQQPSAPQEDAAIRARFANKPSAKALAALQALGSPPARSTSAGKRASVTLPFTFDATAGYSAGDGGSIRTHNVTDDGPYDLEMAPFGIEFPDALSYAMYRVDDLNVAPGAVAVYTNGGTSELGIAAFDWSYGTGGRWELLYYGDENAAIGVMQPNNANFLSPDGDFAVTVFTVVGHNPSLAALEIFQNAPVNLPPNAELFADVTVGQAPLSVNLDASPSWDPDGTIEEYLFDPEGTGTFVSNGTTPTYSHTYVNPGTYHATVQVVDDGGKTGEFEVEILVGDGTYDEVEDNDSTAEANALPALPFSGFSGNIGDTGGNDGDIDDYFSFTVPADAEVQLRVQFSWLNGWLDMSLWDSDGDMLQTMHWDGYLRYEFGAGDTAPFYLHVTGGGNVDYWLSGFDTIYDEIEPNNSAAAWDMLNFPLSGFTGSLGKDVNHPGYDGGNEDWFRIAATPGSELSVLMLHHHTNDFDLILYDNDGDLLAISAGGGPTESISYTTVPGDSSELRLVVQRAFGAGDYVLGGTLLIGGGENYDEVENNDILSQATPLPALPFSGFRGNVGFQGPYDGDWEDYFELNPAPGDRLSITLDFDPADDGCDLYLIDSNFTTVSSSTEVAPGQHQIKTVARSYHAYPLYLVVSAWGESTDYEIGAGDWTVYDEVENNDVEAEATQLPDINTLFWFDSFWGSMGTDASYPGYDGDSIDWFRFDAVEGTWYFMKVEYDMGTAATNLALYDADGDLLATGILDFDNTSYYVEYQAQPGDTSPFYLRVFPIGGFGDYQLMGGIF